MSANPSIALFDPSDPVFRAHEGGKLGVHATQPLRDRADLALLYTPGVADVSRAIAADPSLAARYTARANTVAVITDGTAVLGLGDIGPLAAMPVMEGKAVLFKHFGGVDAVPVCMETGSVDELVEAIARIAPTYGGINLEDISAPRCFEIERQLPGAARHPGLPRRPARHGDRRAGRPDQRCQGGRPHPGVAARGRLRCRRRRCRRHQAAGARRCRGHRRVRLPGDRVHRLGLTSRTTSGASPRRPTRAGSRVRWATPWSVRTSSSGCPAVRWPRPTSRGWHRPASSSRSPTPTRRCTPTSPRGMPRSSPPGARTSRTRSTTCWRSRGSSAAPWTQARRRSPRR